VRTRSPLYALALALAAASALGGCTSLPPEPEPGWLDDPVYARHERAITAFQRLRDHRTGEPAWSCGELCRASDEACQTALEVCTQSGPGRRCERAQQGCSWTRTMLPRECDYCSPRGP